MTYARLYARVSTEDQGKNGFSIGAQIESMRAFCTSQGWTIAGEYIEDGVSAKNLNRPQFKRMMSEAQKGDVIVVYKLDRLTRSVRDLNELLGETGDKPGEFTKRGLTFRSVTEAFETTTASGRLFIRLIAEIAQWERETIAERVSFGMKHKKATGEWSGGTIPFGYIGVPGEKTKKGSEKRLLRLDLDPNTAPLVQEMFTRYLAGEGTRSLAIWLNALGVKTSRGDTWRSQAVIRILTNPFFCGLARVNDGDGKRLIDADYPSIVDRQTFEAVQRIFEARKLVGPRQATGDYPLAGVARCVCGGTIDPVIHRTRKDPRGFKYYTYRCRCYSNGRGCPVNLTSFVGYLAEDAVKSAVSALLTKTNVEGLLDQFAREQENRTAVSNDEMKRLKADLRSLNEQVNRWDDAYGTGHLPFAKYLEVTRPLNERIEALTKAIGEYESRRLNVPLPEDIRTAAQLFVAAWDEATQPQRKALLQSFVTSLNVRLQLGPNQTVLIVPAPSGDERHTTSDNTSEEMA